MYVYIYIYIHIDTHIYIYIYIYIYKYDCAPPGAPRPHGMGPPPQAPPVWSLSPVDLWCLWGMWLVPALVRALAL